MYQHSAVSARSCQNVANESRDTAGFSLVEIMLALAVAGIGMVGLMDLISFQARSQKSVSADLDFTGFHNQLVMILNESCGNSLFDSSNQPVLLATSIGGKTIVDHINAPWGPISNQLSGQTITLELVTTTGPTDPNTYYVDLNLISTRSSSSNVGGSIRRKRPIALKVITTGAPTNQIQACSMIGATPGSGSLPQGVEGETLRHDATGWVSNSSFVITGNGNAGFGTKTPTHRLEVVDEVNDDLGFFSFNNNTSSDFDIYIHRARGTAAAPAPVIVDDPMGSLSFRGYIGGSYGFMRGAEIRARADAAPGPGDSMRARLEFATRGSSDPKPITRITIKDTGLVGIGTGDPKATLDVNGFAKLSCNSGAPAVCDANHRGSIALNSQCFPCMCNGASWLYLDGIRTAPTTCSW